MFMYIAFSMYNPKLTRPGQLLPSYTAQCNPVACIMLCSQGKPFGAASSLCGQRMQKRVICTHCTTSRPTCSSSVLMHQPVCNQACVRAHWPYHTCTTSAHTRTQRIYSHKLYRNLIHVIVSGLVHGCTVHCLV